MNKQAHWFSAFVCAVLMTGCSSVEIVKPVNVLGTGIHLPVSSVAFTRGWGELYGLECEQALKAVEDQVSQSERFRLAIGLMASLAQFETAMEKALTSRGFTFSTKQDAEDTVYIHLQVADCKVAMWQIYDAQGKSVGEGSVGLNSLLFRIEYLNAKRQILGVIQQRWHVSESYEQAAKEVAEFTRKTFASRR